AASRAIPPRRGWAPAILAKPPPCRCATHRASSSPRRCAIDYGPNRGPGSVTKVYLLISSFPLLSDIEPFSQFRQIAPVNDSRPAAIGVDDGFDSRRGPAAFEVSHRLHAIDLSAGGNVAVHRLQRVGADVGLGEEPCGRLEDRVGGRGG